MNKITILLAVGVVSLLPLPALAADATASGELHGFDKYWSMIDRDNKGYVTKDEWLKRAAEHFDEIDVNHDGKITKDEMQAYDKKRYQERMQKREQYKSKQ